MSLFDPTFTKFDGSPDTGRIPTAVSVVGGQELTREQQFGVDQVYGQFRAARRLSITPFHSEWFALPDGTKVHIWSLQNRDEVIIEPVEAQQNDEVLRGFVVSPCYTTWTTPPAEFDATFLTGIDPDGRWTTVVSPYEPGRKREALEYLVAPVQWSGADDLIALFWGFELLVGDGEFGKVTLSDDKYNDVYARDGRTFYKNGAAEFDIPVDMIAGYPALYPQTDQSFKIVVVDGHLVQGITTSEVEPFDPIAEVGYDWNEYSVFVPSGDGFMAAPEIRRTGWGSMVEYRANFMAYNITEAGAVQTRIAELKLQHTSPFHTVELFEQNQLNVQGALNAMVGWNSSTVDTLGGTPLVPIQNPRTYVVGQLYIDPAPDPNGNVDPIGELTWAGDSIIKRRPGGTLTTRIFDRTYSQPETVRINEDEYITIQRSVHVYAVERHSNAQVGFHTPVPFGPGTGMTWFGVDWYVQVPIGNFITATGYEYITLLEMTDNSICKVDVPETPSPLWNVEVNHFVNGGFGGTMEYPSKEFADTRAPKPPTGNYGFFLYANGGGQGLYVYSGIDRLEAWTPAPPKVDTDNFVAISADYVFSDRANGVFVWIECAIAGDRTGNATGEATTTVRWCVTYNGVTHKETILTRAFNTRRDLEFVAPWGINFGTSTLWWTYHQPYRPHPIYAPKWQGQETCPFIAYTVSDELASPRIAAHFRLQLERRNRFVDEEDPPALNNVTKFSPYMMQQLIENYGHAGGTDALTEVRAIFDILEATPTVIKFTFPDDELFENIGAPTNDATEYAKLYRT